ncbi:MAG: glycosyltransferase [Luteitalea sp.]|nr:glycosyltransferase [Luteitalea sp.]
MDVVVLSEERLERTANGAIWGPSSYNWWSRYLEVFDHVRIVARLRDVTTIASQKARANGPGVEIHPVPYHVGPIEYLKVSRGVTAAVRSSFEPGDAVIMRLGCHIAGPLHRILMRLEAPYGVEVVGDPYEVFAPGVVAHPLRPYFRWLFTRQQRQYCAGASAAAYVTQQTLQQRYPCSAHAVDIADAQIHTDAPAKSVVSTHYSSIALDEASFRTDGRRPERVTGPFRLITVGSLEQLYKGTDVLLESVARCVLAGVDVTLTVVGDGKYRSLLESRAKGLGIAGRIGFVGALPGPEAVRVYLDEADLFVLPSRTEGLPRALIEAMARGLPCIASAVGGIPELLRPEDLVPPGRPDKLALMIASVSADNGRLSQMSARNVEKAREFGQLRLRARRAVFYRHLRTQTADWAIRYKATRGAGGNRRNPGPVTASAG